MTLAQGEAPCSLRPETCSSPVLANPSFPASGVWWEAPEQRWAWGLSSPNTDIQGKWPAASPSHTAWGSPPVGA